MRRGAISGLRVRCRRRVWMGGRDARSRRRTMRRLWGCAGPSAAGSGGGHALCRRGARRRQGLGRNPRVMPAPRSAGRRSDRAAVASRASGYSPRSSPCPEACGAGDRLGSHRSDLRRSHCYRGMLQRRGRNVGHCRIDFAAAREDVLRNDRGKAAIGELRIRDLCGEPPVSEKSDAVDVCDIGSVERTNISRIGAIARPIDLARRERKPADLRPYRPGDVQPDPRAAEKADERRRVDRRRLETAGDPAPAIGD